MFEDIYCAISGLPPEEDTMFVSEIPTGWLRVTVEKQILNPQWIAVQMVKKGLIESTLLQIPEEHREMQRMGVEIQVSAQFFAYEEQFEQFILIAEEVYISDPSADDEVKKAWDQIAQGLDLEEDFSGNEEAEEEVAELEEVAEVVVEKEVEVAK